MFFHAVDIRLSDMHLVYNLASVIEMISSPAFNASMFIWSLPVAVSFFISHSAASTSHDVVPGTSFGSVWIMVLDNPYILNLGTVTVCISLFSRLLITELSHQLDSGVDVSPSIQLPCLAAGHRDAISCLLIY